MTESHIYWQRFKNDSAHAEPTIRGLTKQQHDERDRKKKAEYASKGLLYAGSMFKVFR